jgi:hypothetical protein
MNFNPISPLQLLVPQKRDANLSDKLNFQKASKQFAHIFFPALFLGNKKGAFAPSFASILYCF